MRIETVNFSNISHAFPCMEQFTGIEDSKDCYSRSVRWIKDSMHTGFRGKIAFEGNEPIGNIYYGPLKYSIAPIEAPVNMSHLRCIYVKPSKRGAGIGASLIAAMKDDVGNHAGIVVSATETTSYMYYKKFEKFGFRTIKTHENIHYMYHPLRALETRFKVIKPKYKPSSAKTEVTLFNDEFCPFWNHISSQIRNIAGSFGDSVMIREITLNQHRARQYGTTACCLIDGEKAFPGDVKEVGIKEKINDAIAKRTSVLKSTDTTGLPKNS